MKSECPNCKHDLFQFGTFRVGDDDAYDVFERVPCDKCGLGCTFGALIDGKEYIYYCCKCGAPGSGDQGATVK